MRPFHPPRPHPNQPHRGRPGGDPGRPQLPGTPMHPAFPPPVPNLAAAANPMAAAAAANPFLALQLLGQAQQLQSLGVLAAAALQQQQQAPFFPGGFPPNPNQFAPYAAGPPPAGFNGGMAFRPSGAGVCGPRPPQSMMSPAGNNNPSSDGLQRQILNAARNQGGTTRPVLNVGMKDRNSNGEVNHFKNKTNGLSNFASENRNTTTDQKARFNSGRDGRDGRQFGAARGRGRGRHYNQGRGRGSNNWGEIKSNFMSHESPASGRCGGVPAPASGGRQKRLPIVYDANEIKQWVEARKKNYPTKVNINKKLSESQSDNLNKDKDAQLRRQELKEVLAKQEELGFELPELPPGYLSETEDQGGEKKSNGKTQRRDSRFGNHVNTNKRPRHDRGDLQSKRPKIGNRTPRADGGMAKSREPTLLQKLLSSEIKRDRHRLLHAFKFMALNNFFEEWPEKPLQFPSVKVNQIEIESNIATDGLDDLENSEMARDSAVGINENGDRRVLGSINEDDEDAAGLDSSDVDGVEELNEPGDDATA
ncbi:hypothetical protein U9M48_017385 [Paspalum notatum var. saurae]|uniref:FMR1-interacting protein 1 conserved domain-containing protein n=1 Tax=Paspalum notatum var. saurae TaxID=547442 RepID=A0AAQ3T7V0_PASNO